MERPGQAKQAAADVVLDRGLALSQLDGDRDTLAMLVDLFRDDAPNTLDAIRKAVKANDPNALRSAAHKFKGSLSALGAGLAMKAALNLETMGRTSNMGEASAALTILEREMSRLDPELADFGKELRGASN